MEQNMAGPDSQQRPKPTSQAVVHIALAISITATILLLTYTLFDS
ncbi:MAG: hypothetical protein ABI432_09130 [Flavobacteriales bacterium]